MGDSWTVNLRSDTAVEAIAPALERAFGVAQSDVYVVPPPDSPAPAAVGCPVAEVFRGRYRSQS